MHRLKANQTQRAMQSRLREQRRQQQVERQLAALQHSGEEFQAMEPLDEFLKADIPLELDTDDDLDIWGVREIPEPLEEPVDLNPEDIELLVALLGTSRTS
ncbi:unnamed protein product [Phytophthora lilii]|uniref:Unnamed protein product n=1 Tax=Phytophthora lilii TaxID=2077276 RepID=A0A9W6U049_9STRA|nr:unnamed protein product [Phytophthora lilii]